MAHTIVVLALVGAGCSAQHVQLKFPHTERGRHFACTPTTGAETCKEIPPPPQASEQQSGTTYFIMPSDCTRVHQVTVQDAGSSDVALHVICSPAEN